MGWRQLMHAWKIGEAPSFPGHHLGIVSYTWPVGQWAYTFLQTRRNPLRFSASKCSRRFLSR